MFTKATMIGIGVCLLAAPALAGSSAQPEGTVVLATNSGLLVRVSEEAVDAARLDNPLGGAVNTGGITRATTAVKSGGRVFLVGGGSPAAVETRVAALTAPRAQTSQARKSPDGLGTLLAKIFGLAS